MRKKFLSAVLSLSIFATAVTPCSATGDVNNSVNETIENNVTCNYNETELQEMLGYCEKNRPSIFSFNDIIVWVSLFSLSFGLGFLKNYKKTTEELLNTKN